MIDRSNKYFLVGMPSSGKTTIGRHVAGQLGFEFFDLDHLISEDTGKTIAEIFEQDGEDYFRKLERDHIKLISTREEGFVMSTGGGAPCFHNNMEMMNQSGITIFLDVSVEDLFNRLLKKGTHKRPLLKNIPSEQLLSELTKKHDSRLAFYMQAKIHLMQKFDDITERVNQVIYAIQSSKE